MNETTELVTLAKQGDAHAFSRLYAFIYKDLYRFAVYLLQNTQDAEDAVSEAVLDAFARMSTLRDPGAFKHWMFAILSAKCKRKIRQYTNADAELSEDLAVPMPDLNERLDVQHAFAALPRTDRLILSLNLFAGYSSQEIAELLDMNANTVRSRQSRALKRMEKALCG